MKTHVSLDEYPEIDGKAKELLADRLDKIGSWTASNDAAYKQLAKRTAQAGKELCSVLEQLNQEARKQFDAYEMAVINQNEYLLEEVYKQAFRDGMQFYRALLSDMDSLL